MHCSYNETGVALLRPLAPREGTWPELLAVAEKQKAAEASAEAALASVNQVWHDWGGGASVCCGCARMSTDSAIGSECWSGACSAIGNSVLASQMIQAYSVMP